MPGKSKLTADAAEQAVLRALSKSEGRGEADRARAILLTLEGRRAEEIAAVLGVHSSTVRNWRGYFAHGGVAGLRGGPKPGQPGQDWAHAGGGAAAAPKAGTAGQDWAACGGDRRGDPGRRYAPQWRLDPGAAMRRDCPPRRA